MPPSAVCMIHIFTTLLDLNFVSLLVHHELLQLHEAEPVA